MQDPLERNSGDLQEEPDRTDIRVILGYVRIDRQRTRAELRQAQQQLETMDQTFRELEQSVAALQRSIIKLESTVERCDARLWKHTWVVLAGVALIVGAATAVLAVVI